MFACSVRRQSQYIIVSLSELVVQYHFCVCEDTVSTSNSLEYKEAQGNNLKEQLLRRERRREGQANCSSDAKPSGCSQEPGSKWRLDGEV